MKPKKSCPAFKNGRRSPKLVNIQKYKEYYLGKHGVPKSKRDRFIALRLDNQRQHAVVNCQAIVKLSQAKKISASHDDAVVKHVIKAISKRIVLAEFPLI